MHAEITGNASHPRKQIACLAVVTYISPCLNRPSSPKGQMLPPPMPHPMPQAAVLTLTSTGTVTLTQPLTATPAPSATPTGTGSNVNGPSIGTPRPAPLNAHSGGQHHRADGYRSGALDPSWPSPSRRAAHATSGGCWSRHVLRSVRCGL